MKKLMKQGLLLINLGTPDSPLVSDVRRYLREFLSDPRVIDLPGWARFLLLNLIILPWRPKKSAKAYQKIWTQAGAPLLIHTKGQQRALQAQLKHTEVLFAMRYGNPSIAQALAEFKNQGVDRITILPLYPQYASSTTGSSLEAVMTHLRQEWVIPQIKWIQSFYDHPDYIHALCVQLQEWLENHQEKKRIQHLLLSFHGLPVSHVKKTDQSQTHCSQSTMCCESQTVHNEHCYRRQCLATAQALMSHFPDLAYSVSFQSRLGRQAWIGPETATHIQNLRQQGISRLAVMCPSFVSDCLETEEEIGHTAKQAFLATGAEVFELIPCLNTSQAFIQALAHISQCS